VLGFALAIAPVGAYLAIAGAWSEPAENYAVQLGAVLTPLAADPSLAPNHSFANNLTAIQPAPNISLQGTPGQAYFHASDSRAARRP
jgi:hypothetical protein